MAYLSQPILISASGPSSKHANLSNTWIPKNNVGFGGHRHEV